MYRETRIGTVVPAFNEEKLIRHTLETLPDYVDRIVVTDDASEDSTLDQITEAARHDPRIEVIAHEVNQGLGAAVVSGYLRLLDDDHGGPIDIACVMAGDAQMDPAQLPRLLDEIIDHGYSMAKGNRFLSYNRELKQMPTHRLIGNMVLSIMTKLASGYWSIFDAQNGYVATHREALESIDLSQISRGYELENTFLIELNIVGARVKDVPMPAVYGAETSTIRLPRLIPRILWLLTKGFFRRMFRRYVLITFHPVALFMFSGGLLLLWGLLAGIWAVINTLGPPVITAGTVMLSVAPLLVGFQLVLAAIVLDIVNEPR